jgi:SAM-dependent methyltransferase
MPAFTVPPDAYDQLLARYAREIAPRFTAFAGLPALTRGPVLDVGCGTGALAFWLARQFGGAGVAAVEPAEAFAAVARERVPGADVRVALAEALPFRDGGFEAALAQLVLSFVRDAPRAAAEMRRVVRSGGVVAACVFEADGFGPARVLRDAAGRLGVPGPSDALPLRRPDELAALWTGAGLRDVETGAFEVEGDFDGLDDLWAPLAAGVGPSGAWLAAQPAERRAALRDACRDVLAAPRGGFTLAARVVAVRGRA